jgi:hypothetical protein
MQMTRAMRWIAGSLALLLPGCTDGMRSGSGNPLSPAHVAPQASTAESAAYPSESEVPPEYQYARVYTHSERIAWSGRTATGYTSMQYFGNRGEQVLEVSVLHGYSTVGSTRAERHVQGLLPAARVMGNPLSFTVAEDCGQTAQFQAHHRAKTIVLLNTGITTIWSDQAYGTASATQPTCRIPEETCAPDDGGGDFMTGTDASAPGGDPELSPYNFAYDPYNPGDTSPSSDCSGGGETPAPAEPEPTFAEMCTALGGKLYYDYGCIEQWNKEKGQWEPEWCGTYAVCES